MGELSAKDLMTNRLTERIAALVGLYQANRFFDDHPTVLQQSIMSLNLLPAMVFATFAGNEGGVGEMALRHI